MKKILIILLIFLMSYSLVGCSGEEQSKEPLPDVSQNHIDMVTDSINQDSMVKDVYIEADKEKGEIVFSIIINGATNESYAKEIADSAVRQLSGAVSNFNDGLEGPTKNDLGELYDYYDIMIALGTGSDNIMYQGVKVTGASRISW